MFSILLGLLPTPTIVKQRDYRNKESLHSLLEWDEDRVLMKSNRKKPVMIEVLIPLARKEL